MRAAAKAIVDRAEKSHIIADRRNAILAQKREHPVVPKKHGKILRSRRGRKSQPKEAV